jgi:HK97 family phage major capsid protein
MKKNKLLLTKQRSLKAKKLTEKRAEEKRLNTRAAALDAQLEAVEDEIPAELEQQIQEVADSLETVATEISDLEGEIADLDNEIAEIDEGLGGGSSNPSSNRTRDGPVSPSAARFRCRSRCFENRTQRDAFYANGPVKDFLQRVRSLARMGVRSVTGAELTIPTEVLDILRDNLNQYSKLITKVRLRSVSGHARQNVVGKVPEGIWMEMSGALSNLEFRITDIETDGFKVGGFIPIDNYILNDSDVALGEEILYMLGQAIGYAVDKAIVFGLGPNSRMPVGAVTRLAQTEKPAYWGDNQGEWTDLHSSNVLQLNLASMEGTAFFIPFLSACAKAKPTFTTDGKIWIMNDATRQDIQIRALAFNANAALMSGVENTMPVVGGEIITLEFMPDHMIVGGYGNEYLLVEREGGSFASSDAPLFLQDKTVFKGTARYDGQPISGEAFVALTYDNTAPTTKMSFAVDYANTSANALIITSAAGGSGKTVLTVAGVVGASNKLKAIVGAPASIAKGDVPGNGWTAIESGKTALAATTGMGATVVELDKDGKVISIGYCASVTAGA